MMKKQIDFLHCYNLD